MPRLIRLYVRAALTYGVLGFVLGVIVTSFQAFGLPALDRFYPAAIDTHIHFLGVGLVIMMIVGVSYWLFPPDRKKRYSESQAYWTFWLLNAGLLLRLAGRWLYTAWPNALVGALMLLGGLLMLAALFVFIYNIRTRIRPPLRELIKEGKISQSDLENSRL